MECYEKKEQETRNKLNSTRDKISSTQNTISQLAGNLSVTQGELNEVQNNINEILAEIEDIDKNLNDRQDKLSDKIGLRNKIIRNYSKKTLEDIRKDNLKQYKEIYNISIEKEKQYLKLSEIYNNRAEKALNCIKQNSITWTVVDCNLDFNK